MPILLITVAINKLYYYCQLLLLLIDYTTTIILITNVTIRLYIPFTNVTINRLYY